ncbi:TolC family protein [Belliella marina]|uniref:TolC family protein n=1 Tax=Belliella marina TaxID=1644146 RepID=A0ABW4VJS8_9BACT
MDIIRSGIFITILFLLCFSARAQDTLRLSREEAESVFLKENLLIVAERLSIPQAEAMVMQAKLWPNPTFSISEVNLWATERQTGGQEVSPPFWGNFGRNQQIGFDIEQLIQTAGKRKKLIALEQVSVEKSKQYFEDLLRNLKIEFRNQLTQLQYLQMSRGIYKNQLVSIKQLTKAYQSQVEQGNIPKGEYIRLKALELEIAQNINELNKEVNVSQKELKLLMRLPSTTQLEISEDGYLKDTAQFSLLVLNDLIEQAKESRPDFKIAQLEEDYSKNLYAYEKAQRVPDIVLNAGYDRNGNTMLDFVGVGISMDIPFFNRNQGNIKHAQLSIDQSKILSQQKTLDIENELVLSYQNLSNAIDFLAEIEPGYEAILDVLLDSYTKNFIGKNISLLEYLDFLDAYLENKIIILETGKEVNEKAEELNYFVGLDLIK